MLGFTQAIFQEVLHETEGYECTEDKQMASCINMHYLYSRDDYVHHIMKNIHVQEK